MPQDTDTDTPRHGSEVEGLSKIDYFLSHVRLSQMQSYIHGVQFFDQDLPEDIVDYADWMQRTELSIQAWQDSFVLDGSIPGWSINAADQCRLLLYRPCSRNMVPDESCLRAACMVATRIIKRHWSVVQEGNLILSFQYVFTVFQAGMILLYALGNHGASEMGPEIDAEACQALELLELLFVSVQRGMYKSTD